MPHKGGASTELGDGEGRRTSLDQGSPYRDFLGVKADGLGSAVEKVRRGFGLPINPIQLCFSSPIPICTYASKIIASMEFLNDGGKHH